MEPMETLHEIVAADKAARMRCAAVRQENDGFDAKLENLRRELTETEMARAERDVAQARERSVAAAGETLAALDRQCEQALSDMEGRFTAEKDRWAERIFRMVVGLDE